MVDGGEIVGGLAEMVADLAVGIVESCVESIDFGFPAGAEQNKIVTLGEYLALEDEELNKIIVELDPPADAQIE